MINGINLEAIVDYVCPDDKENPTIWQIACMPSFISGQAALGQGKFDWASAVNIIRVGLKGFKNFKIDGKEVIPEFVEENIYGIKLKVLSMNTVNTIPPNTLMLLMKEIMQISKLSDKERKN